jgi:hypothetical protein
MCTRIVLADGDEIDSVAELRRVWPTLVERGAGALAPAEDEDHCLCGIDVEASARRNGARVTYDHGWDEYTVLPETEDDQ